MDKDRWAVYKTETDQVRTWELNLRCLTGTSRDWSVPWDRPHSLLFPPPAGCFRGTLAKFSSCVRDPVACKPNKLHSGPLQKKFANPWVNEMEQNQEIDPQAHDQLGKERLSNNWVVCMERNELWRRPHTTDENPKESQLRWKHLSF